MLGFVTQHHSHAEGEDLAALMVMCLHAGISSGQVDITTSAIDVPDESPTPPVNNCTIAGPGAWHPLKQAMHLLHYPRALPALLLSAVKGFAWLSP